MVSSQRSVRRISDVEPSEVATREQLLIAAGDLMAERRSTDVSLSDIAKKSGLNSALVKYYFGNKSGLLVALLRMVLGPGVEQLQHLVKMNLPPRQKLRIHISGMARSYFLFPYVNRLMHQLLSEDSATYGPLIAEEFIKPVALAQQQILDEGVASGIFRALDPLLFYFHVVGACDQLFFGRYQLEHVFGVSEITDELQRRYVDHLCGVILNGVLSVPDAGVRPEPRSMT